MHDKIRNDLEDIALGEGPEYYISNKWLNPRDIPEDEAPEVRAAAQAAVDAYDAWKIVAKTLQDVIERWMATQDGQS